MVLASLVGLVLQARSLGAPQCYLLGPETFILKAQKVIDKRGLRPDPDGSVGADALKSLETDAGAVVVVLEENKKPSYVVVCDPVASGFDSLAKRKSLLARIKGRDAKPTMPLDVDSLGPELAKFAVSEARRLGAAPSFPKDPEARASLRVTPVVTYDVEYKGRLLRVPLVQPQTSPDGLRALDSIKRLSDIPSGENRSNDGFEKKEEQPALTLKRMFSRSYSVVLYFEEMSEISRLLRDKLKQEEAKLQAESATLCAGLIDTSLFGGKDGEIGYSPDKLDPYLRSQFKEAFLARIRVYGDTAGDIAFTQMRFIRSTTSIAVEISVSAHAPGSKPGANWGDGTVSATTLVPIG